MAIALVGSRLASGSNGGTSSSLDTSGSSLLVLTIAHASGGGITISDSKSNTWTPLTLWDANSATAGRIYYVTNPTVGTGHTFTIAGSSIFAAGVFTAWSGADTSTPFDQQSGISANTLTTGTALPGSITPAANNELLVCGIASADSGTLSVSGGFTIALQQALVGGTSYSIAHAYLIQTTATAANPSWTVSGAAGGSVHMAAFKAAAAGTNVTPTAVAATFVIPTPTFTLTTTPTPTAVAQSWTIPTPVISTSVSATVTKVTGVFTIPTPVPTVQTNITATAVAATFVIPTPTFNRTTTPTPTAVAQSWTIPTPSVTTGSNVNIGATAVPAVFVIPTPAIAGTQVAAVAAVQSWTIPTPAVTTGSTTTVTVTAVAMVATIPTPTFTRTTTPTPTAVAMICAAPTPTFTMSANILATVVAAVFVIRGGTPTGQVIGGNATQTLTQAQGAAQTIRTTGATQEFNP